MPTFARELIDVARHVSRAAPDQGGIVSGQNPTKWNPTDPLPLWIIQVFIIVCFTRLLAIPLRYVRQPQVIAEIIGGIILGPTVMGRIPNFTNRIFPKDSIPMLTLTSTVGLVLFLFLIGLEIDVRVMRGNAKKSLTISAMGMILPFGLGMALAAALYHQFVQPTIQFGHFLLFVGVAVSITAFPVLCRILTDLNLLGDQVGVVVLSAGVGNDVVGWILLALAVTLTNATSGLTALWILMAGTAFVLFMLFPGRWSYVWLARRTGSLENGAPTPLLMTVTLLVIFVSAFFTDIIGIHAIFGGFIAGLIIPHEGGFAIAIVEKLEDLVCIILIPIYFTLSGLRTNLGLLNNGITWGYVILTCTIAFFGKFLGCAITARVLGFNVRESGAIGTLMSCKGLVELIVLNIGLQAGILDTRLFSMFVVHAVILTVLTTPLTLLFYPPEHRKSIAHPRTGSGKKNERSSHGQDSQPFEEGVKSKFAVLLHRIEHLPAIMNLVQLLQPLSRTRSPALRSSVYSEKDEKAGLDARGTQLLELPHTPSSGKSAHAQVSIDALRLIELTDRTSAVMKSSEADELLHRDALISIFSTFGRLNGIPVSTSLSIVAQDSFSTSVATHARNSGADLVIVPWHSGSAAATNVLAEQSSGSPAAAATTYNPFDGIFGKGSSPEKTSSVVYANFVRKVFSESPADVALFVDRGGTAPGGDGQHIFLPFFGGPDDRLALRFVVQLCMNANISATVLRVRKGATADDDQAPAPEAKESELTARAAEAINALTVQSATGFPDTIYGPASTETRIASDTADNILWSRLSARSDAQLSPQVRGALDRVTFAETTSTTPLRNVIQRAAAEAKSASEEAFKSLLLVVGRARRLAVESHHAELRSIIAEQPSNNNNNASGSTATTSISGDVTRTVGEVAAALIASGTNANVLVMQAASPATEG